MNESQKRKLYLKAYRQSEKGKAAQKRYKQSQKGKANHRKTNIRYYNLHPERVRARDAVKMAIRNGRLPRPNNFQCSCSEQAEQYHHHKGYAQEHRLDVIPICKKCHIIIDRKIA